MLENKAIWIDTDTGVDDAVALLTACRIETINIVGVSAVHGNTTLTNTLRNARDVLALADREDIPVYRGASGPLMYACKTAEYVHGDNGLGGVNLPPSSAPYMEESVSQALRRAVSKYGRQLVVVALGPLTNIARLILEFPEVRSLFAGIYLMGGAVYGGNVTPCAEFNIYSDPQAAEIVFQSGIPLTMFGLDVTMQTYMTCEEFQQLTASDTAISNFLRESTALARKYYEPDFAGGMVLHDVCPIMALAYPDFFTTKLAGVFVETQGQLTMGKTVCDLYSDYHFADRHVMVATDVLRADFVRALSELLQSYV